MAKIYTCTYTYTNTNYTCKHVYNHVVEPQTPKQTQINNTDTPANTNTTTRTHLVRPTTTQNTKKHQHRHDHMCVCEGDVCVPTWFGNGLRGVIEQNAAKKGQLGA